MADELDEWISAFQAWQLQTLEIAANLEGAIVPNHTLLLIIKSIWERARGNRVTTPPTAADIKLVIELTIRKAEEFLKLTPAPVTPPEATRYQIYPASPMNFDPDTIEVTVRNLEWVITKPMCGQIYNKSTGQFMVEPPLSERDSTFIEDTGFTLDEALRVARALAPV